MNEPKKINVLILGSGGREHALAWKIQQSPLINNLYVAPGNTGTNLMAENLEININNYNEVKNAIISHSITILIVGPEKPLVSGLHDKLIDDPEMQNLQVVGPKKEAAKLEGSKLFAKKFMQRHSIPTADFQSFNEKNIVEAKNHLKHMSSPFVIKADGLAAGKGVFICNTLREGEEVIDDIILRKKFGEAGSKIVIESFLTGIELSVFILTNGESYKILPTAKDYKRIGENNSGLNTGGMGAVSPVSFLNNPLMEKIKTKIIEPTLNGLKKENIEYSGFLFFGLINVNGEPFVIEYNVRLGDPETQAIMPRIESDLLDLLQDMGSSSTFEKKTLKLSHDTTTTVILTSGGYPEKYETGHEIFGLDKINENNLFHAGIKLKNEKYLTSGGRVLAITAKANDLEQSIKKCYEDIEKIKFKDLYFRKDIGRDLIK